MAELEEENEQYRQALNLPPSIRPALGKGPTGKDKPKPPYTSSRPSSSTNSTPSTSTVLPSLTTSIPSNSSKSRPSPSESPSSSSARTHSLSPSNSMSIPSQPFRKTPPTLPGLETSSSWDHHTNIVMPKEQQQSANQHTSPRTASFTLNPGPHSAQPQLTSFGYSEPMPSRSTQSNAMYIHHPQNLPPPPPPDRQQPVREQYNEPHFVLRDVREERQHYSFSQPSFPSPHDGSLHSPVPHDTSQMNSMAMSQHRDQMTSAQHQQQQQQQQQQSFAHRRSITEPQGFRGIINQYPHLPSPQAHSQQPDYPPRLPPPQKVADPNGTRSGYGGHESRRMI